PRRRVGDDARGGEAQRDSAVADLVGERRLVAVAGAVGNRRGGAAERLQRERRPLAGGVVAGAQQARRRVRPRRVPEFVEQRGERRDDRARRQQVHVDEVRVAAVEVLVGNVAATGDGEAAVGDQQLVVHAAVDARELVRREGHPRREAAAARRQRVEEPDLEPGQRGKRGEERVLARRVEVVDENADAHAARRGGDEGGEELTAGAVVGDQVVLDVDRALGAADQREAGFERIVGVGKEAKAGAVGGVGGSGRSGDLAERGRADIGDRVRFAARDVAGQRGAAGERGDGRDGEHAEPGRRLHGEGSPRLTRRRRRRRRRARRRRDRGWR